MTSLGQLEDVRRLAHSNPPHPRRRSVQVGLGSARVEPLLGSGALLAALAHLDGLPALPPRTLSVLFRGPKQHTLEEMLLNRPSADPASGELRAFATTPQYLAFLEDLVAFPTVRGQAPLAIHAPTHMTAPAETVERLVAEDFVRVVWSHDPSSFFDSRPLKPECSFGADRSVDANFLKDHCESSAFAKWLANPSVRDRVAKGQRPAVYLVIWEADPRRLSTRAPLFRVQLRVKLDQPPFAHAHLAPAAGAPPAFPPPPTPLNSNPGDPSAALDLQLHLGGLIGAASREPGNSLGGGSAISRESKAVGYGPVDEVKRAYEANSQDEFVLGGLVYDSLVAQPGLAFAVRLAAVCAQEQLEQLLYPTRADPPTPRAQALQKIMADHAHKPTPAHAYAELFGSKQEGSLGNPGGGLGQDQVRPKFAGERS